jgi:DNA-binding CsgD family transcriptional regulator
MSGAPAPSEVLIDGICAGFDRHVTGTSRNAMIYADIVKIFLEELQYCTDAVSLEILFSKTIEKLGFPLFAYNIYKMGSAAALNQIIQQPQDFIISNFPKQWRNYYFREKYEQVDPVLQHVGAGQGVVRWSALLASDDVDTKQRRVLQDAWDAGLADGVTLPIVTELGESVAISIVPEPGRNGDESIQAILPVIHLLAQHYHRKAKGILLGQSLKIGSSRRKSLLSPREVDVLHWTAKGKTAWEVAGILGISQKSVDFYMDMAKTKLQATNRTHAVVKAIMFGLVTLD